MKKVVRDKIKHVSTYGLSMFMIFTPFEYPLADLMVISPLRLIGLTAMMLACFDILKFKKIKIDYRVIYIFLWLIYGLFTIFWEKSFFRFKSYYFIYFNNAAMFLLFSMISFTRYELEILKRSLIFGIGLLLLYMKFIPGAVVYGAYQHRLTLSSGLDENYLAAIMLTAFGIVSYRMFNNKQKKSIKILSTIYCVFIIYYVILTGSRSGFISLMFILMFSVKKYLKRRFLLIILAVIIIAIFLPKIIEYLPQELLGRFTFSALTGREAESGTRLVIWRKALESLENFNILYGYGVGSSQTIVGNAIGIGRDMAIHNHYIAMLVEEGMIGFLLINILIFKMIKNQWKRNREVAISFCGLLIVAFFVDVLTTKFFWCSMILLSVSNISEMKRKS